eukprot:3754518-Rhodomonas_salina.1
MEWLCILPTEPSCSSIELCENPRRETGGSANDGKILWTAISMNYCLCTASAARKGWGQQRVQRRSVHWVLPNNILVSAEIGVTASAGPAPVGTTQICTTILSRKTIAPNPRAPTN